MGLKLLLKRGALLAAANWPIVAIQFVAQTAFQVLLALPLVGAAVLVAVLLGRDVGGLLQGGVREVFTHISGALASQPVAFGAFIGIFAIGLVGGSILMFLVKAGTVDVLVAAHQAAAPIERDPLLFVTLRSASAFSLRRYLDGCRRLFRRFLALGIGLMVVYGLSAAAYLAFIVYGYQAATGVSRIGWTVTAALASIGLVAWMTAVNLVYLLMQVAIASDDVSLADAARRVAGLLRRDLVEVAGVLAVVLVLVAAAIVVSALVWSGVGLIAFVPLVGLAVLPLQAAALLLRGLVFQYVGLSALGAYVVLYGSRGRAESPDAWVSQEPAPRASIRDQVPRPAGPAAMASQRSGAARSASPAARSLA
ncbi:MAG: hypothetical protein IT176_08860 [Acidobacteria bacterium]|nr:hypothetical protein [Acidobacteriota bacterium]